MFKVKRAALVSAAFAAVSLLSPIHPASASPPVLDGLTVSLDSRGGSTISGSTWSGQDGTTNNATLQTSTQYDATNQYITMNDSTSPNYASLGFGTSGDAINPIGDMTVEVWVKFNTVHTSNWNIFATKWFAGPSTNTGCTNSSFHFGLLYGKVNVYTSGAGGRNINGTTTIANNSWHQFAFTMVNPSNRNGSSANLNGTLSVYVDGVLENTATGTNVYQTIDIGCELILGDGRSSGLLGIDGGLEKFRMYNRALSAAEINKNYRADANIHALPAAPYNTVIPGIVGPHTYAATDTGTVGTWINSPSSWSYQWYRASTANGTYSGISGANSLTYTTVAADVGKFLKFSVASSNSSGTIHETSTATSVITKSGVPLSFSISNPLPVYRTTNNLTVATSGIAGSVTFKADGKQIAGCRNISSNSGNSYIATCPWKPSIHKAFNFTAVFTPTDTNYISGTTSLNSVHVRARTTKR